MNRNRKSGLNELQHTADISIEVWSDSLQGIIISAFEGMSALINSKCEDNPTWERQYITVEGDFEEILINFLNEVIYLLDIGIGVKTISVTPKDANRYVIRMFCSNFLTAEKMIKAVTFSNVALQVSDNGYRMRIVFDV